jgi:porin
MMSRAAGTLANNPEDDELITQIFDPNSPQQQKISAFQPMPAMPHTVKELQYASGNWFGPRDFLHEHGLDFSTVYTGVFIGNPVGGKVQKFAYADNISLSLLIETEKLFGWKGGHFVMSAMQQDGGGQQNLSSTGIGNLFTVNGIVGGTTIKWVNLYWNQDLWDNRINLIVGRCCAMDEFDNSPVLWNYVGSLQANPTNLKTTWSPNASWGSRLKLRITHDSDLRYGIYQITNRSINGLNWNFYPNDSASMFAQYTWNPEFCKPGSSSILDGLKKEETTPSKEERLSEKSFTTPVDISTLKKLPGHYFVGGFYTSEGVSEFPSLTSQANASAFYIHGDQMVYRPNPMTDAGLIFWTEWGYSPESENALLTLQAKGGAVYQGLIPGRINDFTIFGFGYGDFNSNYASYRKSQGQGDPTYEMVAEFGYRINFTRFFYAQPDIQYIINPGGSVGTIPNALVLGAQIGMTF